MRIMTHARRQKLMIPPLPNRLKVGRPVGGARNCISHHREYSTLTFNTSLPNESLVLNATPPSFQNFSNVFLHDKVQFAGRAGTKQSPRPRTERVKKVRLKKWKLGRGAKNWRVEPIGRWIVSGAISAQVCVSEWQNHGDFGTCITFGLMHACLHICRREPARQQGKDVNKHRISGRLSYSALVFPRFDGWGFGGRKGKRGLWRAPQQKGRKKEAIEKAGHGVDA
jgi:hypothetical protein